MIGKILAVRPTQRFAWIIDKDFRKYFASFKQFVGIPLSHTCVIREGAEVEFHATENPRRDLAPNAVNVSIIDSEEITFPSEGVEATITVWNGDFGFARTDACQCENLFLHRSFFITCEEYLTPDNLRVGSRVICDLEDVGKPNAAARNIELFKPETS